MSFVDFLQRQTSDTPPKGHSVDCNDVKCFEGCGCRGRGVTLTPEREFYSRLMTVTIDPVVLLTRDNKDNQLLQNVGPPLCF